MAEPRMQIFISYQQDAQTKPAVRRLYHTLTKDGYTCWIDFKQLAGGDRLIDTINEGIENCRVVVACVTTKFTQSDSCCYEISRAVEFKKPIIPLLLEPVRWPPQGKMREPIGRLMYIDCTDDVLQKKWHGPKFSELCIKIDDILDSSTDDVRVRPEVRNDDDENDDLNHHYDHDVIVSYDDEDDSKMRCLTLESDDDENEDDRYQNSQHYLGSKMMCNF